MVSLEWGHIKNILDVHSDRVDLEVLVRGRIHHAIAYRDLTGTPKEGERVLLNTTATRLKLGTGGVDFVVARDAVGEAPASIVHRGMKMKYSPLQVPCSLEEETAPNRHRIYNEFPCLRGIPVLVGELHSMVAPAVAVLYHHGIKRVSYIMSDHGALPMAFSNTVRELKQKKLLNGTITIGNAFGGDFECVNIFSGLAAAVKTLKSQAIILTMGPGIYGTGTMLGFSGIEMGHYLDDIALLRGSPIYIPRLSFRDNRARHYGMSHHSITLLSKIIQQPCHIAFPLLQNKIQRRILYQQILTHRIHRRHSLSFLNASETLNILNSLELKPVSMGRTYQEDPVYFDTVAAAAQLAASLTHSFHRKDK
ncbi:MAG: DUF3866 family protein [Clostridia bacterium]|jgi:hypothetical protein